MTPRRALLAALLLLPLAFVVWKVARVAQIEDQELRNGADSGPAKRAIAGANAPDRASASATPAERSPLADALNSPATDIRADLGLVAGILETFRSNFLQAGNPVGNNAEITAALVGQNPLRLALIPANHPAINRAGELCDRWGTPFFFHAESAKQMEIRSAGPDRKMWSDDDVVLPP